jgi:hypothetical protein
MNARHGACLLDAFVFWPLFLIYFAIAAASGKGQAGKAE